MLATETGFGPGEIESMTWRERERWVSRLGAYNEEVERQVEEDRDDSRAPTPEEIDELERDREAAEDAPRTGPVPREGKYPSGGAGGRTPDSSDSHDDLSPSVGDGDREGGEEIPIEEIRRQYGDDADE